MTLLETAEPDLDRAFALAVRRGEALLASGAAEGASDGRLRLGGALLAAGRRAPARRMMREFAATAQPSAALLRLSARYTAWTGEESPVPPPAGPAAGVGPPGGVSPGEFSEDRALETARRFLADPDGAPAETVTAILETGVLGLWGIEPDAPGGGVAIRPQLPEGWRGMALRRLRIGSTVLDLSLRRRADLVARVRRAGGPRLIVSLEPRPREQGPILVDDVELHGASVRFELAEQHEVIFRGPP
jgi:hypothetical protein